MYAIVRILEMMAEQNTSFGLLFKQLPEKIHLLHRRLPCPWGKKGQVMRMVHAAAKGARMELVDGVKIHFADGWVLVTPDPNEAYCHVWAEAKTEEKVKQYLDEFTKKVEEWQKLDEAEMEKKLIQKKEIPTKKFSV